MEPQEPGTGITRRNFELVIRRAAELSLADADADEEISEEEVVRIAAELGLPARAVRQALYEVPLTTAPTPPGLADKLLGPGVLTATRAVQGEPTAVGPRLEDYLTTREYLQVRRRFRDHTTFSPADDTVSSMFRFLFRSSRQHYLAKSSVALSVRPLEEGWSHVRLDLDLSDRRRRTLNQSLLGGTVTGAITGTGSVALATGLMIMGDVSSGLTPLLLMSAGAGGFGAGFALVVSTSVARFRRWTSGAREEVAALLDRAERGESLAPPPAPWWRRLRDKR